MMGQPLTITDNEGHTLELADITEGTEPAFRLTIDYQASVTLSLPAVRAMGAYADAVRNAAFDRALTDDT